MIGELNADELKEFPLAMRQPMAMVQPAKFLAQYQNRFEPQKNRRQKPAFEHLKPELASHVVDYRKPAAFSPSNYFETVRWWIGAVNMAHRKKVTGNTLLAQKETKEPFAPFMGKPMAWIMRVKGVSQWYVDFYGYMMSKKQRRDTTRYPNGTGGFVALSDSSSFSRVSQLVIGSQVSKEQAVSLRQGDYVIVQGRLKDVRLGFDNEMRIVLDNIVLTPTTDFRRDTIYPQMPGGTPGRHGCGQLRSR